MRTLKAGRQAHPALRECLSPLDHRYKVQRTTTKQSPITQRATRQATNAIVRLRHAFKALNHRVRYSIRVRLRPKRRERKTVLLKN
jgi:hypothetical protein